MSDIAVIIPHYNNLVGLKKSLRSISNKEKVDVIIIDDGSDTKIDIELLDKNNYNINNIIMIERENNGGIEYALNDGLEYCIKHGYKYIARLDCGDTCHPERFKIQKNFLDENREVYLVGSWVEFVDLSGNLLFKFTPPINHLNIEKKMFINNMFAHPAVMFRSEVVNHVGFYPLNRKNAEDYAYFFKIVKNFKVANIDTFLLKCEINPNGLSLNNRRLQIKNRIKTIFDNFDYSVYAFYGIIRNIILLFVPYKIVELLKRIK